MSGLVDFLRRRGKPLRLALGLVLGLAGMAFLLRLVLRDRAALAQAAHQLQPGLIAASVLALLVSFTLGVAVWQRVVRLLGANPPGLRRLLAIWFVSGIARYMPGKVWRLIAAAALAEHAALDVPGLLASMLVHAGISAVAALLLAALSLPLLFPGSPLLMPGIVLGTMLSVGLVHPFVIRTALRLAAPLLRSGATAWTGSWLEGLGALAFAAGGWVIYSAAFMLLAANFTPLQPGDLPAFVGITAVAFLAGQAAIIVPAGLGVRELALTALLQPFATPAVAALIALASRVWIALAELAGVILAVLADRLASRRPLASSTNPGNP